MLGDPYHPGMGIYGSTLKKISEMCIRRFLSGAAMLVCLVLASMTGASQFTLTDLPGTTNGSFTTLKGAFDKINYGTHERDIVI
jgi:hypothetical protein